MFLRFTESLESLSLSRHITTKSYITAYFGSRTTKANCYLWLMFFSFGFP